MTQPQSTVVCRSCGLAKPRSAFDLRFLSNGRANGIKTSCRECIATRSERRRLQAHSHREQRFWSKISCREGENACWVWSGRPGNHGYGQLSFPGGRVMLAHRIAWELTYGPIPRGLCVCHTCDNRLCCNPRHLFLGTNADNVADRHAKGRTRTGASLGQDHGMAKLTESEVLAIRSSSDSLAAIARRFGISDVHVGRIRRGKNWRHI
jgi:hypothetical protein